jgi:acetate CoA/acetoacetate CoA-transferase beta subunit
MNEKEFIARRVAKEFEDGDVVNLGIGLPTLVANFVPDDIEVSFQSENGFLGVGPSPLEGAEDIDLINAGGQPVTILDGGCYFDSAFSFAIIRGGHVDVTVLGALQVDQKGNLANWMVPGKMVPGMGGAMDLVTGANKVIIAMTHTAKGKAKILKECTLPLTATGVVSLIITELCVLEITKEGLVLKEIAPGVEVQDVIAQTEADIIVPDNIITISI